MKEKIRALIEKSKAKYEEGVALMTKATEEERDLSGEDLKAIQEIWLEVTVIKDKADALEAVRKGAEDNDKYFNQPLYKHPLGESEKMQSKSTDEQKSIVVAHKSALKSWIRTGNEASMLQFKADYTGKIEEKALNRLTDPAGGYFVGTEFRSTLIEKRDVFDKIRPRCEVSSTTQSKVSIPAVSDSMVITMAGEQASTTEYTGDIAGQLVFTPHTGDGLVKVSTELLEDSEYDIEALIARRYGVALGKKQFDQWIDGTGVKEPEGVLRAGITDHDIATAASGAIVPKDIQDFTMQLDEEYLTPGCAWVMPTATLSQIILLRQNSDGANTGSFLWEPSFKAGVPAMLQGYPVIRVAAAYWPTISSDGDPLLVFGDWSLYMIVDRTGFQIQRLDELYARNRQVGFQVTARWDGKLSDVNGFARLNRT